MKVLDRAMQVKGEWREANGWRDGVEMTLTFTGIGGHE